MTYVEFNKVNGSMGLSIVAAKVSQWHVFYRHAHAVNVTCFGVSSSL